MSSNRVDSSASAAGPEHVPPPDSDSHGGHSHGGHSHGGHSHGGHSSSGSGGAHSLAGHGVPSSAGFVAAANLASPAVRELGCGEGAGKILFLDCQSGVAGDMTLAALIDLGVPRSVFDGVVSALGLSGVELVVRRGYAGAIGSTHVTVSVAGEGPHRSYGEIRRMLALASLPEGVRQLAERIFARLASAEAEVHRVSLDEVHFHEVGGEDAIVDIVGAAAGFCFLGARVIASPLPLGRGHVACRHGVLPLPAPAALLCLRGVPTVPAEVSVELVTPTGAAIVAEVAEAFVTWPRFTIERLGWGAGTRGLPDRPNVLRAVLGSPWEEDAGGVEADRLLERSSEQASHVELSANIDDMTPEVAAYALSRLLAVGAVDAWLLPTTMKKGRPGLVLCALVEPSRVEQVTAVFFSETTTIGVRKVAVSRSILPRRLVEVDTRFGPVPVKVSGGPGGRFKPEVDACIRLAEQLGIPLREVLAEVEAQAHLQLPAGREQGVESDPGSTEAPASTLS